MRDSGRSFLAGVRKIGATRTAGNDLHHAEHGKTKAKVADETWMAALQALWKNETCHAGTGTAGAARLLGMITGPMGPRDTEQTVYPVRGANSLCAGSKRDKCFFCNHSSDATKPAKALRNWNRSEEPERPPDSPQIVRMGQ